MKFIKILGINMHNAFLISSTSRFIEPVEVDDISEFGNSKMWSDVLHSDICKKDMTGYDIVIEQDIPDENEPNSIAIFSTVIGDENSLITFGDVLVVSSVIKNSRHEWYAGKDKPDMRFLDELGFRVFGAKGYVDFSFLE